MSEKPTKARDNHVYCFVPEDGLNFDVLRDYVLEFIDATATLWSDRDPKSNERKGFTIGASRAMNRHDLKDVIEDSRDWFVEQQPLESLRGAYYRYHHSNTWEARKKKGPSNKSAAIAAALWSTEKSAPEASEEAQRAPPEIVEDRPSMYMHYTISQDYSGDTDTVMSSRLAALSARDERSRFANADLSLLAQKY